MVLTMDSGERGMNPITKTIINPRNIGKARDRTSNLLLNPLPDMPILGPSNSAANKDMMSKI